MKVKIENYKKIKRLLFFAKETFLNEKGQEIEPTLENLVMFRKELRKVTELVHLKQEELEHAIYKESED